MNIVQRKHLAAVYDAQPIVVDRLHHTVEFSEMCTAFNAHCRTGHTQHDIYRELLRMRKSKALPRKTKNKVRSPRVVVDPQIRLLS